MVVNNYEGGCDNYFSYQDMFGHTNRLKEQVKDQRSSSSFILFLPQPVE